MEDEEDTKQYLLQEKFLHWDIYKNNRAEEESWRLKSRSLWVHVGDQNTSLFHNLEKAKNMKNHIAEIIESDGKEIRGLEKLKREVYQHFKILFSVDLEKSSIENFTRHIPNKVTTEENEEIMKDIEEEELRNVIWSFQPDRCQGQMSFPSPSTVPSGILLKNIS